MTKCELSMIIELWNKPKDIIQDWYDSFDDECRELIDKRENMLIYEDEFERKFNDSEHKMWILKSIIETIKN